MTNKEYSFLRFIREHRSPSWADVLNAYDLSVINDNDKLLKSLLSSKFIRSTARTDRPPHCHVTLTPEGAAALEVEDERRVREKLLLDHDRMIAEKESSRRADEIRSQRRHDWTIALVGAFLGAVLGVAGTMLAQYLSSLLF